MADVLYYGSPEFIADLHQMEDSITTISTELDTIEADVASLNQTFTLIESVWQSPAGTSFTDLQQPFSASLQDLINLLTDILARLKQSYENYSNAEAQNVKLLQGKQ
jgi:WXG100 family type VII secretion target